MSRQAIETVVFDLGNVFVEWSRERLYEPLIPDEAERRAFLDNVLTAQVNVRLDRGELFDDVLAEVAVAHPQHRELVLRFGTDWERSLGECNDAMIALLSELRGRVGLVALTNWSAETFPVAQRLFDWLDLFDGHVVSGQEGVVKPDPAIYRLLTDRYGLDPAAVWFTDDSQANVDAARALGWSAELFIDAARARSHLVEVGVLDA